MSSGTTRERFRRDPLPIRLGNLASNLSRIETFSTLDVDLSAVAGVIEESLRFIEWTEPDADAPKADVLSDLKNDLKRWQESLTDHWNDSIKRRLISDKAGAWSNRLLEVSGLL